MTAAAYGPEYQAQRAAEKAAAEKEQKERERQNAALRKERLDRLAAERTAKQAEHDAKTEVRLAPARERAKREWLYNHPDQTPFDFDQHAWPLLRANLLEDEREQLLQNEIIAQRERMGNRY